MAAFNPTTVALFWGVLSLITLYLLGGPICTVAPFFLSLSRYVWQKIDDITFALAAWCPLELLFDTGNPFTSLCESSLNLLCLAIIAIFILTHAYQILLGLEYLLMEHLHSLSSRKEAIHQQISKVNTRLVYNCQNLYRLEDENTAMYKKLQEVEQAIRDILQADCMFDLRRRFLARHPKLPDRSSKMPTAAIIQDPKAPGFLDRFKLGIDTEFVFLERALAQCIMQEGFDKEALEILYDESDSLRKRLALCQARYPLLEAQHEKLYAEEEERFERELRRQRRRQAAQSVPRDPAAPPTWSLFTTRSRRELEEKRRPIRAQAQAQETAKALVPPTKETFALAVIPPRDDQTIAQQPNTETAVTTSQVMAEVPKPFAEAAQSFGHSVFRTRDSEDFNVKFLSACERARKAYQDLKDREDAVRARVAKEAADQARATKETADMFRQHLQAKGDVGDISAAWSASVQEIKRRWHAATSVMDIDDQSNAPQSLALDSLPNNAQQITTSHPGPVSILAQGTKPKKNVTFNPTVTVTTFSPSASTSAPTPQQVDDDFMDTDSAGVTPVNVPNPISNPRQVASSSNGQLRQNGVIPFNLQSSTSTIATPNLSSNTPPVVSNSGQPRKNPVIPFNLTTSTSIVTPNQVTSNGGGQPRTNGVIPLNSVGSNGAGSGTPSFPSFPPPQALPTTTVPTKIDLKGKGRAANAPPPLYTPVMATTSAPESFTALYTPPPKLSFSFLNSTFPSATIQSKSPSPSVQRTTGITGLSLIQPTTPAQASASVSFNGQGSTPPMTTSTDNQAKKAVTLPDRKSSKESSTTSPHVLRETIDGIEVDYGDSELEEESSLDKIAEWPALEANQNAPSIPPPPPKFTTPYRGNATIAQLLAAGHTKVETPISSDLDASFAPHAPEDGKKMLAEAQKAVAAQQQKNSKKAAADSDDEPLLLTTTKTYKRPFVIEGFKRVFAHGEQWLLQREFGVQKSRDWKELATSWFGEFAALLDAEEDMSPETPLTRRQIHDLWHTWNKEDPWADIHDDEWGVVVEIPGDWQNDFRKELSKSFRRNLP